MLLGNEKNKHDVLHRLDSPSLYVMVGLYINCQRLGKHYNRIDGITNISMTYPTVSQ